MRTLAIVLAVLLGLVLLVGIGTVMWGTGQYNRFVELEEGVEEAWSQVENNYQRRLDLVPNLVETVKGVADFEQETFTAVAEARAKAGQVELTPEMLSNPQALARFEQAQSELGSALSRLLVTVERYPQLKASESFRDLLVQLEGTENRIAVSRRNFNQAVRQFNTAIRRFPARLVAAIAGYESRPYFEATEGAEEAPAVSFE
jgi:LemA protein